MAKLSAEHRKAIILDVCNNLAKTIGLYTFEMTDIVAETECSESLIKHYFNSVKGCREALIQDAIENDDNYILAQAIVCKDPLVKGITLEHRNQIFETTVLKFEK